MFDRRKLLIGAAALIAPPAAAFEWQKTAPADAGFAPDMDARLDKLIADKRAWGLHGVIVVRSRRILLERYFEGEDQSWGKRLGSVAFTAETLHDLRSVSKSIVALIYGIALADKKVPPPDAPLFDSFPDYADLFAADERRKRLTIAHALTMTLGTDWNELTVPYTDPANSEIAMERAKDRYRYVLERQVVGAPGKRWVYNGGATALLGKIIANGTGRHLHDYARAALFDPIGLGKTEWSTRTSTGFGTPDEDAIAASGLRMTPRDLARVGQLVLDGGAVDGRQVVPKDWLAACLTPRVSTDEFRRYGYQWYMGDLAFGPASSPRLEGWVGAVGNGGQRLVIFPELELVIVVTAGNYSAPENWVPSNRVIREVILPSLR
jgi:CubicO group peptidase (beta-lactamase class C family)